MAVELLTPTAPSEDSTSSSRATKTRNRRLNASSRLMDWILWQVALVGPMSADDLTQLSGVSRGRCQGQFNFLKNDNSKRPKTVE